MRWLVDDVMSGGVDSAIVAEVAHRTLDPANGVGGVGDAVLPSGWRRIADRAGCGR